MRNIYRVNLLYKIHMKFAQIHYCVCRIEDYQCKNSIDIDLRRKVFIFFFVTKEKRELFGLYTCMYMYIHYHGIYVFIM